MEKKKWREERRQTELEEEGGRGALEGVGEGCGGTWG